VGHILSVIVPVNFCVACAPAVSDAVSRKAMIKDFIRRSISAGSSFVNCYNHGRALTPMHFLSLTSLLLLPVVLLAAGAAQRTGGLALVGGTIYVSPTEEPIRNGVVLINDGKIAAVGAKGQVKIPASAQVIDCAGRTITAGFWNSHVHFMERKWVDAANAPASELNQQLQEMLTRYGFTAAFDLSSIWENTRALRDRIESGEVRGPRIYSTGLGMIPADPGLPPDAIINFMGWVNVAPTEVADAAQAQAAVRKLLDSGVDGIKLFISAPSRATLSESVIRAAVDEAHRAGKPVFVHPNTGADVLLAARAGIDVIAHTTPASGPWDQTIITAMKERGVALAPTLWIWKWYARHDRQSTQDKTVNAEVEQLRAWVATGGTVLFGTDLGAVDPDPTGEYTLMAKAGMNFRQILASLTTLPADRFGKSASLGRVAVGLQADLVVLKNDPSKDIRALTDVQYTLRDGKIIYRQ
jgi:imidazolonepropionase-like amidohydrolase